MTLLEVEDLHVEIPLASGRLLAVRGVDLTVSRGEVLGIVGESGCGKSLTSLALMSLLPRRARRRAAAIRFEGRELSRLSRRRMGELRGDRVSMIFQEPMTSLNPVLTIGEQLEEVWLRHRPGGRAAAKARALELLEKVGIAQPRARLTQYPHQLSGGLRQRVMIAMALMCGPDLIIADEPTTALDVTIQAQVLLLLKRLQRELGMAMILITHDLGVIARMADRVVVMYAGEVVETGPVREIFTRPMHPYTQGLLRCLPGYGVLPGGRLGTIGGTVPMVMQGATGCGFAARCPFAFDACRAGAIPLAEAASGHSYRCLLPPERLEASMPVRD
jgi:peptide/nickel transport system ATP-binding protein